MFISKSDYSKYNQCIKLLWLYKNRKDLIPPDLGEQLAGIVAMGETVEEEAYKLFPDGVKVRESSFRGSINETSCLVAKKTPAIFQASFFVKDLYCRADIIEYDKKKDAWNIYEVKSATRIKEEYLPDLAFQNICLAEAGLKLNKTFLVHVNNFYVRQGDIDPSKLLAVKDLSRKVGKMVENARLDIGEMGKIISSRREPSVRIVKQCHNPYTCMFLDYCWKHIPEHSVYNVYMDEEKLKKLLAEGIIRIEDVPAGLIANPKYSRYIEAVKSGKKLIDREAISKELKKYAYPLYFLDYETNSPAVPMYDGYRPYQRMVFQYSLHVIGKPGGRVKHYEYLAQEDDDPSPGLARDLSKHIGPEGSVIAWFKKFEAGCNAEMGERYPEFSEFFESINGRLLDLMDFFANGYYVDKNFFGSSSLKKVLPVIAPHLSYKELNIQEGGTASESWLPLVKQGLSAEEKENLKSDMLKYCELDTFAMVEIFAILKNLVRKMALTARAERFNSRQMTLFPD